MTFSFRSPPPGASSADMMAMIRSIQTFMLSEPDSSKNYITMYITLYYVMYILFIYMHIYVLGSRPPNPWS